jgi:hypothetical protein
MSSVRKYTINKYHTVNPFINQEDKLLVKGSNEGTRVENVNVCYSIYRCIGNWLGGPLYLLLQLLPGPEYYLLAGEQNPV